MWPTYVFLGVIASQLLIDLRCEGAVFMSISTNRATEGGIVDIQCDVTHLSGNNNKLTLKQIVLSGGGTTTTELAYVNSTASASWSVSALESLKSRATLNGFALSGNSGSFSMRVTNVNCRDAARYLCEQTPSLVSPYQELEVLPDPVITGMTGGESCAQSGYGPFVDCNTCHYVTHLAAQLTATCDMQFWEGDVSQPASSTTWGITWEKIRRRNMSDSVFYEGSYTTSNPTYLPTDTGCKKLTVTSTLNYVPDRNDDELRFICHAKLFNRLPQKVFPVQERDVCTLMGVEIAEDAPTSINAAEGSHVVLNCSAHAYPPPIVMWRRKDTRPLPNGNMTFEGALLNIQHVRGNDTGAFICRAESPLTEFPAKEFQVELNVGHKPQVVAVTESVDAALGKNIELLCQSSGYPQPTITWIHDGTILSADSPRYTMYDRQLTWNTDSFGYFSYALAIANVTESDFGEYSCTLVNIHGEATVRLSLVKVKTNSGDRSSYTWIIMATPLLFTLIIHL